MQIAIYGAGNYGRYVLDEVKSHECAKVTVAFWIDNYVEMQEICGLPVYTEERFFIAHKFHEIDAVVIAMDRRSIAYAAAASLLERGYKQVYLVWPGGFMPKVPVLNEKGEFTPFVKLHNLYKELKPIIPHVEVSVTNYCNLKCKRCGNFSNLVTEMDYLNLDVLERDLEQLSKKVKNIETFSLLGGEPLLYPQLDNCIALVGKYFPKAYIQIVTNGLLIPDIPSNLIEAMKHYYTGFYISQYAPTRNNLHNIVEFLEKEHIRYEITPPRTTFRKLLSFKDDDIERAYEYNASDQCTCHVIDKGRIYLCSNFPRLYAMQDYFDIHIEEKELKENAIDLFDDKIDGWDIMYYFTKPTSLCRFCSPKDLWIPWETGKPERDDWIAD